MKKILLGILITLLSRCSFAEYFAIINQTNELKYIEKKTYTSCLDILNNNSDAQTGIYNIVLNREIFSAYCDMETQGGGWTLILSTGTEYPRSHSFWDGVDPDDGQSTTYNGYTISSTNSSKLLKYLKFNDLMFDYYNNWYVHNSSTFTTFSDKKTNLTPFSNLTWNTDVETGGYTNAYYLLGRNIGYEAWDDYFYVGIGLTGRATSRAVTYGTSHARFSGTVNCGRTESCLYVDNYTSHATLGHSKHRYVSGKDGISGLFFR